MFPESLSMAHPPVIVSPSLWEPYDGDPTVIIKNFQVSSRQGCYRFKGSNEAHWLIADQGQTWGPWLHAPSGRLVQLINMTGSVVFVHVGRAAACECGIDTLGYGLHSEWCPKHEETK